MTDPFETVPGWQRTWIAAFARERAAQTFLVIAEDLGWPPSLSLEVWESGGQSIMREVEFAVAPIEDAEVVRLAKLFGAAEYLRCLVDLVHSAARGGRA